MQRIALYSHDTQGLGHLRRTLALAGGLADAAPSSILLATGVREVGVFPLPRGTDVLSLPRLKKNLDGQYSARSLDVSLRDIVRLRSAILRSALAGFRPDVLIVDHGPGGVAGELLPALASLRAAGTRLVLGLREVLDDPLRVQLEWARTGFADLVRRHYDAIWVYGDPRVHDPAVEYGLPRDLTAMVRHAGYVHDAAPRGDADERAALREQLGLPAEGRLAVCTAGGGKGGQRLLATFATAALPPGMIGALVPGPFLPPADRRTLEALAERRSDLHLVPFTPHADRLVAGADRVIATGGYGTACEVLAAGTRALVVPRVHPRSPQLIRAQRLARLGAVDALHPDALTRGALTRWLSAPARRPDPLRPPIDVDGRARVGALLREVLDGAARRPQQEAIALAAG